MKNFMNFRGLVNVYQLLTNEVNTSKNLRPDALRIVLVDHDIQLEQVLVIVSHMYLYNL